MHAHSSSPSANTPASLPVEPGILRCSSVENLADIGLPGTELVLYQHELPDGLEDWLATVDPETLPDVRFRAAPSVVREKLVAELDDCGLEAGPLRDALLTDIDALVATFARITQSDEVDVRLERVVHDSCWKFHRDSVDRRLLATYRGPGTQWVRMPHSDDAITQQRDYDGPLEEMGTDQVALFKGSRARTGQGVVHRSPPINGTGQTRLILCLNQ